MPLLISSQLLQGARPLSLQPTCFSHSHVCLGGISGSLKRLLQFEIGAVVSFFGLPNPFLKAGEQGHKKIALEEGDQKHKVYF